MKKSIGISLLSLIVLVFGILPWFMGLLAQRAMVEVMNANMPTNSPVTYQLISYQRHWFSSDVVYTVTSKSLAISANQSAATGQSKTAATIPTGITVTEKVYHGPIVFTYNLNRSLRVYFGQAVAKGVITSSPAGTSFQSFFPNAKVTPAGSFQELTTLGLSGRVGVDVAIPALTLVSTNSASVLKTSPMNVYATTNHSMQKFSLGMTLTSLTVLNQENTTLTLNNWELRIKMRKSPEQLLLGQMRTSIADVTANLAAGRRLDLQGLNVTAQSDIKHKLLDSDSQLTFDRLVVNNKQFGPGIAKLSFKRFDPKAQAELAKLNSYATPQTPWAQAAMVQEASRLISKLIAHGAQINIDPVNVKTSDGDVNLALSVKFPTVKGKVRSLPMQLHNTNASFELALPKVLAHRIIDATNRQQIQLQIGAGIAPNGGTNIDAMVTTERTKQVNDWLNRGFMVSRGDNYAVKLVYKQGTVYVNGKALKDLFAGSGMTTTSVQAVGAPVASAVVNSVVTPSVQAVVPAAPALNQAVTLSAPLAAKVAPAVNASGLSTQPTPVSTVAPVRAATTGSPSAASSAATHNTVTTAPTKTTTTPNASTQHATSAAALTSVPAMTSGANTAKLITVPAAALNQAVSASSGPTAANHNQPAVSTAVTRSAGVTVLTTSTPTVSLSVETGH